MVIKNGRIHSFVVPHGTRHKNNFVDVLPAAKVICFSHISTDATHFLRCARMNTLNAHEHWTSICICLNMHHSWEHPQPNTWACQPSINRVKHVNVNQHSPNSKPHTTMGIDENKKQKIIRPGDISSLTRTSTTSAVEKDPYSHGKKLHI